MTRTRGARARVAAVTLGAALLLGGCSMWGDSVGDEPLDELRATTESIGDQLTEWTADTATPSGASPLSDAQQAALDGFGNAPDEHWWEWRSRFFMDPASGQTSGELSATLVSRLTDEGWQVGDTTQSQDVNTIGVLGVDELDGWTVGLTSHQDDVDSGMRDELTVIITSPRTSND